MSQSTLNLGILAHVDAGKTSLTERLLYAAGVIDRVGSVDQGTTQTDSLALERQRGITIRSAVASFAIGELAVNLIDTPGHPDFIAEVDRALRVLDGAVLVVSGVEGVQSQTRILMRALRRLSVPVLVFVNKLDRIGADLDGVLEAIAERLGVVPVAMGAAGDAGSRAAGFVAFDPEDPAFCERLAEALAAGNEALLASVVGDTPVPGASALRGELVAQTRAGLVVPVYAGSAITGAGALELMSGIAELLPASSGDPEAPVSAAVFKIERDADHQRIASVRMFSGTIHVRDRVRFGSDRDGKVTALAVFARGGAARRDSVAAGSVARVWGLAEIQVGDWISGGGGHGQAASQFAPPTMEAAVVPSRAADRSRLWTALTQLAEQDPLIAARRSDDASQITVSLYGEVQREVIAATLEADYGIAVGFDETLPICVERPARAGEAAQLLNAETNPFAGTLGLRVEPAEPGAGVDLALATDHSGIPLHLFGGVEAFKETMRGYVREALAEGLWGWRVSDCTVTITRCDYGRSDGPPSRRGPGPTFREFRRLSALVAMQALERAGTTVCHPVVRARLEFPAPVAREVTAALVRLGATIHASRTLGRSASIEAVLPVVGANELQRQLAGLTTGEGVLETELVGYEPVPGARPVRPRTTPDPRNLKAYLASLA